MDNQGGSSKLFWNVSYLPTSTASYHRKLDYLNNAVTIPNLTKQDVYYTYRRDRWQSWTQLKTFNVSNCSRNNEEGGIIMKTAMLIKTSRTNAFKYLGINDRLLNKWGCKRLMFMVCPWNFNGLNVIMSITFELLLLLGRFHPFTGHEGT